MKRKIFVSLITTGFLMVMALIAGCSSKTETSDRQKALAICIGNHANSCQLNLNSMKLQEAVIKTISGYGYVTVISVDGIPECISMASYELPAQYANANPAKLESDNELKASALLGSLSDIQANDPETDVLESLRLAVRALSDLDDRYEKCIYIVDTGLSTSGIMNFSNNLIAADAEALAEELAGRKAIPDFSDIIIYWQQLGDVAYPQQSLTPSQLSQLKLIWKTVINKTGGQVEFVETPADSPFGEDGFPDVTEIYFPEETPIEFTAAAPLEEPQFLSEEQCRFVGDSDQYVDPEQVYNTLLPIAEYMSENPSFNLMLIGTTAGDDNSDFCMELSYYRAEAVKRSLIEMGIDGSRIYTAGLGCEDPWHIYGVGTDSELAARNRKVVLLDADSTLAESLKR